MKWLGFSQVLASAVEGLASNDRSVLRRVMGWAALGMAGFRGAFGDNAARCSGCLSGARHGTGESDEDRIVRLLILHGHACPDLRHHLGVGHSPQRQRTGFRHIGDCIGLCHRAAFSRGRGYFNMPLRRWRQFSWLAAAYCDLIPTLLSLVYCNVVLGLALVPLKRWPGGASAPAGHIGCPVAPIPAARIATLFSGYPLFAG